MRTIDLTNTRGNWWHAPITTIKWAECHCIWPDLRERATGRHIFMDLVWVLRVSHWYRALAWTHVKRARRLSSLVHAGVALLMLKQPSNLFDHLFSAIAAFFWTWFASRWCDLQTMKHAIEKSFAIAYFHFISLSLLIKRNSSPPFKGHFYSWAWSIIAAWREPENQEEEEINSPWLSLSADNGCYRLMSILCWIVEDQTNKMVIKVRE